MSPLPSAGLVTGVGSTAFSNFPTASSLGAYGGGTDAFVTQYAANFASINLSTFLGGSGTDSASGVACDLQGNIYVAGSTNSTSFPATGGVYQTSNAGGFDAFVSEIINTPAAPVITGISPASSSTTITITSSQNIHLLGTSSPSATVTVSLRGTGVLGTTTASSSGTWNYDYSTTTLPAGTYDFTVIQTVNGVASPSTSDYLVTIAPASGSSSAPSVTLSAPLSTSSVRPAFVVSASDPNGSLGNATVTLSVNQVITSARIGLAGSAGPLVATTGTLVNGTCTLQPATALTVGSTYTATATVTGLSGVVGTSNTQTITVGSVSGAWTVNAYAPSSNVNGGQAGLQLGNVSQSHNLVLDQNGGSMDGGASLIYNSDSVSQHPIIQATLQTSNNVALPSTITGTLTWDLNGTNTKTTFSYATSGRGASPGDLLTLAVQSSALVTTSGRYVWSLAVNTPSGVQTITGVSYINAQDTSNFGAGWTFGPVDQLVAIPADSAHGLPAGMLRLYGSGGYAFYAQSGSSYTSPSGDNGTLNAVTVGSSTTYSYSTPDGQTTPFNSSGQETQWTSSDGLSSLQYTYGTSGLASMTAIDGTVTTFNYSGGKVSSIQTGNGRSTPLSYSGSDLAAITDPSGVGPAYTYSSHRMTQETNGITQNEWGYSSAGTLATLTTGAPTAGGQTNQDVTTYTPAITIGLAGLIVGAPQARTVDALGDTTIDQMDLQGRITKEINPVGGISTTSYDVRGFVIQTTDALGRTVTDIRDSQEYVTQETSYAIGVTNYVYSTGSRHLLLSSTNALNQTTSYAYNSLGQETSTTNALNLTTSYTYSATTGQQTSVTDPLNHTTASAYNTLRQQISTTDALGNVTLFTYDSNGYQATATDPLGHVSTTVSNVMGQVTQSTNALNQTTTFTYDTASGLELSSTDPLGHVSQKQYDPFGRGEVQDQKGAVGTAVQNDTLSQFDKAGQVIGTRNADGFWTSEVLDPLGRAVIRVDAQGNTTQTNYDLAGQVTATRDADGGWTYYQYNSQGLVTKTIDPLGNVTTRMYNAIGQMTSETSPSGEVTSYTLDAMGRNTAVTTPTGTTSTVFDAAGNTTQTTDPVGNITTQVYDADNRNTSTTTGYGTAVAETTSQVFDAAGNVTSTTDGLGNTTSYVLDALNRVVQTTLPGGAITTAAFDAAGNQTQSTDALGNHTTFVYNALNQQVQTTDPNSNSTSNILDAVGQAVGNVDAKFNVTQTIVNSLGQTVRTVDGDGNITKKVYDASGNLISLTDPDGNITQWTYNNNAQELTQIDPLGNKTTLTYDNEKRLISETDANGRKTTYTYDTSNRVTGSTWYSSSGTVVNTLSYTYDKNNNFLTESDINGTLTYTYDAQNRLATTTDVFGITLTYHYDTANNVTSRTDSLGGQTNYVYNTNNLETSQQFSGTGLTPLRADFTYTSRNDLSTIKRYSDLAGTILVGRTTYGYDNAERLTGITNTNSGGTLESSYNYLYDTANRVTSEAWTSITATGTLSGTHTTSYDVSSQIVSADGVNLSYDSNGNRTITGYSTSTDNRLVNDGTYTYTYDNIGNRISKMASGTNPDTWAFGYDQNNRLTSVIEKSNGTTVNFTGIYTYDVRGDLIEEQTWSSTAGSNTVKHTFAGTTLIADLNSSLTVQTRYFHDPNGHLLAEEVGSSVNWVGTDHLGSIRDMFGMGTTVTAHIEYTAFGVITLNTAPAVAGNVLFQGMYQQGITGFYVTEHRIYDPATGRWLTVDPIGFNAGDPNLYRFVGNDPTNAIDPSGTLLDPVTNIFAPVAVAAPVAAPIAGGIITTGGMLTVGGVIVAGGGGFGVGYGVGTITTGPAAYWMYNWWYATELANQRKPSFPPLPPPVDVAPPPRKQQKPCFPAGTCLLTPTGIKAIEQFQVGDKVLSCSEFNPGGKLESKEVEEVFVGTGKITNLHVEGEIIRTTAEHPFFAKDRGWISADQLEVGNLLLSHNGKWVAVEDVFDTGEWVRVYNLRIADYHTYFVGGEEWDFSVWAHNACQGYRVMDQAELADAMDGIWTDSDLVVGDPDEEGSKWLWVNQTAAQSWRTYLISQGETGLSIALVPTRYDISTYPQFPHPPQGTAVQVPIPDLGPAIIVSP